MANSFFQKISNLFSGKKKNKNSVRQALKTFYKNLFLESLDDRVTPANASWNGSELVLWFNGDAADSNITISNGGGSNLTVKTSGTAWVDGDPTVVPLTASLPTGVTLAGTTLSANMADNTLASLTNIVVKSNTGARNYYVNFGTGASTLSLQAPGSILSSNIGIEVNPSVRAATQFQVFFQNWVQTRGNGAININAGSTSGAAGTAGVSSVVINDNINTTNPGKYSLLTTGSGGITLQATNSQSFVNLGVGNTIATTANAGGDIVFQGGTVPASNRGVILRNTNTVQTASGGITFQGANSATLVDTTAPAGAAVLSSTGGGNITIQGTLDNNVATTSNDLTFSTSGNVTVSGAVGNANGRFGNLIIQKPTISSLNNLTFSSFINADRLALNNAAAAIRGNISIVGNQDYLNSTASTPAIDLQT
ncbi:MAG: hypothetical protein ACK47R_20370, partial [Planctomycetia bacterium]